MDVDLSEAEEIQQRLRAQHRALGEKPRQGAEYQDAVNGLLRTTVELLDSKDRAEKAAEERRRLAAVRTIRMVSAVTAGVAALVLVSAAAGWVSRWWLLMGVSGLLALVDLGAESRRPRIGQDRRLLRAVALAATAAAAVLVAFGALPGWCAVIVVLAVLGVLLSG
ncbi:hypothetical protein Ga0074812_112113 [Parafrankia irregularis]|uniref:Uncharacterized protein n=1 Tax=Parafrankia irregularis TaxID=795642 RepID=A0A0S4QPQ7_9ACTN|nr:MULTISPECIES: hypothetical protein [Parafrankia]MBE3201708.1 hypothetical protein [Parafrankia sp. CH37]CUU57453.1 hypothetical protein Ga0074812_112113 [Parafrankia irregularis]